MNSHDIYKLSVHVDEELNASPKTRVQKAKSILQIFDNANTNNAFSPPINKGRGFMKLPNYDERARRLSQFIINKQQEDDEFKEIKIIEEMKAKEEEIKLIKEEIHDQDKKIRDFLMNLAGKETVKKDKSEIKKSVIDIDKRKGSVDAGKFSSLLKLSLKNNSLGRNASNYLTDKHSEIEIGWPKKEFNSVILNKDKFIKKMTKELNSNSLISSSVIHNADFTLSLMHEEKASKSDISPNKNSFIKISDKKVKSFLVNATDAYDTNVNVSSIGITENSSIPLVKSDNILTKLNYNHTDDASTETEKGPIVNNNFKKTKLVQFSPENMLKASESNKEAKYSNKTNYDSIYPFRKEAEELEQEQKRMNNRSTAIHFIQNFNSKINEFEKEYNKFSNDSLFKVMDKTALLTRIKEKRSKTNLDEKSHSHLPSIMFKELDKESVYSGKENERDNMRDSNVNVQEDRIARESLRLLQKINKVQDSLSDEENFDLILRNHQTSIFAINPEDFLKKAWDFMIILITFYSLIFTPYYLGFIETEISFLTVLEAVFDIAFFIDIIINFFTAYYNYDEELIQNLSLISIHYLKTWFCVDLFASIPWTIIVLIINAEQNTSTINHSFSVINKATRFTKIYRMIKFTRLFKIVKISNDAKTKHNIRIPGVEELNLSSSIRRFMKFAVSFLLVSHLITCIWVFIGKQSEPSWLTYAKLRDSSDGEVYVSSLYFHWTTIFTIGYGDIIPTNGLERIYNCFLMFVGVITYSFAVSSLGNIVSTYDSLTLRYYKHLDTLEEMKSKYDVPDEFYDKVAKYLSYNYKFNKNEKYYFINDLPIKMRNQLLTNMYKDIIRNFQFLTYNSTEFTSKVVFCMRPLRVFRKEYLVIEGEYLEEVFFVRRGVLSVHLGAKYNEVKVMEIRRNEHFGDILVMSNQRSPITIKVSSPIADLLIIRKQDLHEISSEFPENFEDIFLISSYNFASIIEIAEKKRVKIERELERQTKLIQSMDDASTQSEITSSNIFAKLLLSQKTQNSININISKKKSTKSLINLQNKNTEKIISSSDDSCFDNSEQRSIEEMLNKTININNTVLTMRNLDLNKSDESVLEKKKENTLRLIDTLSSESFKSVRTKSKSNPKISKSKSKSLIDGNTIGSLNDSNFITNQASSFQATPSNTITNNNVNNTNMNLFNFNLFIQNNNFNNVENQKPATNNEKKKIQPILVKKKFSTDKLQNKQLSDLKDSNILVKSPRYEKYNISDNSSENSEKINSKRIDIYKNNNVIKNHTETEQPMRRSSRLNSFSGNVFQNRLNINTYSLRPSVRNKDNFNMVKNIFTENELYSRNNNEEKKRTKFKVNRQMHQSHKNLTGNYKNKFGFKISNKTINTAIQNISNYEVIEEPLLAKKIKKDENAYKKSTVHINNISGAFGREFEIANNPQLFFANEFKQIICRQLVKDNEDQTQRLINIFAKVCDKNKLMEEYSKLHEQ